MENIYLILPGCDDTNRGDQALIWETVSVAREAGYCGDYYMIAPAEKSRQSESEGIHHTESILPHPSIHFKNKNNIQYDRLLKIKWALVSVCDGVKAVALLWKPMRNIVKRFYPENVQSSIEVFERADAAFVKGGGFLHSYGGLVNTYANFYDLYHIILALSMGKDVYVMPNSYGPFLSPGTGRMIRKVLSKCSFISVRESISQKMLSDRLGIKAELFLDLAFYLEPCSKLDKAQADRLSMIPFERKCVAITVRPYRFPGTSDPEQEYEDYKHAIKDFIVYLDRQGYYPVLVEHTFSLTEHEQDMSCIRDIAEMLGDSCGYTVYSDRSLDCRQFKYVYSKFEYILGTRFHSVIFSLAAGVPAIAVTYGGNKGQGIMKDMGLSEYALSIGEVDLKSLTTVFDRLVQDPDHVKKKIRTYLDSMNIRKEELIKMLKGTAL